MTADADQDRESPQAPTPEERKDVMRTSFEKETSPQKKRQEEDAIRRTQRSLMGAPMDPNSPTTRANVPPGIDSQELLDPGRSTPGAPPLDSDAAQKKIHKAEDDAGQDRDGAGNRSR